MFLTETEIVEFLRTKMIIRNNNRIVPEIPLFTRRQPVTVQEQVPAANQKDEAFENVNNATSENENAIFNSDEIALRVEDLEEPQSI